MAAIGFALFFLVVTFVAQSVERLERSVCVECGVVIAFIMLSLVPLTGWSGQISFAQITFAGMGAWAGFEFSSPGGNAFGLDLYPAGSPLHAGVAAVVAVPIGLLMALPALRLQGLYLALATMAFALMAESCSSPPEVYSTAAARSSNFEPVRVRRSTSRSRCFGIDVQQERAAFSMFTARAVRSGRVRHRRAPTRAFGRRLVRHARQPGRVRHARRQPARDQARGVRAVRRDRRPRGSGRRRALRQRADDELRPLDGLDGAGSRRCCCSWSAASPWSSGAVFGAGSRCVVFTKFLPHRVVPRAVEWPAPSGGRRSASGLAGIGIARQPEGVIPQVGHDLRERKRPRRHGADAVDAGPARRRHERDPDGGGCTVRRRPRDDLRWRCSRPRRSRSASAASRRSTTCRSSASRRSRHRADRAERRRQDDAVQRHHRPAGADRRPRRARRPRPHRREAAQAGAAGHRPHVPAARDVRHAVGPRQRARRRGDAPRLVARAVRRPGELVDEIIERVGLESVADERVDPLPDRHRAPRRAGSRARRAARGVLLLDEPSAGLNESETTTLGTLLRELAETGLGVLLVEHDMSFVMGTCAAHPRARLRPDHRGGRPAEIQADPKVRAAYLGSAEREATSGPATRRPSTLARSPTSATPTAPVRRRPTRSPRSSCGASRRLRHDRRALRRRPRASMPGQVYALLGPNGAGKSTTLKVASGQIKPDARRACSLERRGRHRHRARHARARRRVPRARGPRHLPEPHGAREPAHGDVQRARSLDDVLDRSFTRFPRLARAAQAARRHAVGRRAADARRWRARSRSTRRCCCSTSSRWGSRR